MGFLILTSVLYTISCNKACDNTRVRNNLGTHGRQVRTRWVPVRVDKTPLAMHKRRRYENQIRHVPHKPHDSHNRLSHPNRHGRRPALQSYSWKEKYLL
jgi:hypothetical protein